MEFPQKVDTKLIETLHMFRLMGRNTSDRRMNSMSIIKFFNVFKDTASSLVTGPIVFVTKKFSF